MKRLAVIVISVSFTACINNKRLQTIQNDLERQRQELKEMLKPIDELDKKRQAKWKKGELDEKTDSIAKNYIRQLKDSISFRLQHFDALSDNTINRKNKRQTIAYLNKVKGAYKKELDNIIFLDDLFDASTFSRLNTAAFFASGQYMLSDSTYQNARTIMSQIARDALNFSARYPTRKLQALFIVTGYADEEAVAPESELHKSLASSISDGTTGRKQLNKELSSRRAVFIKDLLAREYYLISRDYPSTQLSVSFLSIGKGEELPRGIITNYQPTDERRRVVLLYWSILPEL